MHVPRCIVVAMASASLAVGFAGAAAGVEEAPVGYERFDVKPAGLSILVPDGMRIAKPSGDVLFSAVDGGKYIEHGVTVIRSNRYTSLPSLAAVRSNAARLRGMGAAVRIRRTSIADEPAVSQTLTLGKTASRSYFLEPRAGRVVFVSYTWPTSERAYTQVVDTAIGGLSIMRD